MSRRNREKLDLDYYVEIIERPQQPNRQGYDSLSLQELMGRSNVPGLSIAVIKDFRIHWTKGYGIADVDTGMRVDRETIFQAGSVSKPVATMALLKAVQNGRFSLDDDINDILSSWKLRTEPFTKQRQVSVRMLASHTSGLGDGFGFPGYLPHARMPTLIQILEGKAPSKTGPVSMVRPPLSAMQYSGGGSMVLQLALQDSLEMPFEKILKEHVLDPIGMTSSAYEQPLSRTHDQSAARAHNQGRSGDAKWLVYPELFAAGLWSTPTDLAKFLVEVQLSFVGLSNRVLSRAMIREMLTPVGVGDFGVGFRIERRGQGWYFSHGGANCGFTCLLQAHVIRGYGLAVMTNAGAAEAAAVIEEIRSRVERAYDWDSLDKPVPRP